MAAASFLSDPEEVVPWEERLAEVLTGGKEDLSWVRKSFNPMKAAGWREKTGSVHPASDFSYYTPEGERKRILALPVEEGREYFSTRDGFLAYVTKRMTAYFEAKEKGTERKVKDLLTPGRYLAGCIGLVGRRQARPLPPTPFSPTHPPSPTTPKIQSPPTPRAA